MGVPSPTESTVLLWPSQRVSNSGLRNQIQMVDYEAIRNGIATVRKQLFRQEETVEIIACRWNETDKLKPCPIFSVNDLITYLDIWHTSTPSPTFSSHLYLINQENTKACLDTTEEGLNTLLDRINAFPQLGNSLPAFAAGDAPASEGRNDFYAQRLTDQESMKVTFHLSLLLKYVEPNGNKSSPIPWSIRQQLLYQNFDESLSRESIMLLRASTVVRRRIQDTFYRNAGYPPHWTNVVLLAVATLVDGWPEYLRFLDLTVWNMDKSATFTDPFMQSLGEANSETLHATKTYYDILCRSIHALQGNMIVLEYLLKESKMRKDLEDGVHAEQYDLLDLTVEDVRRELNMAVRHLNLIQSRLARITESIRDSIALRSSHHAGNESRQMRMLALQSNHEARTVKAIALVTLIYLPATFVATFMGMGYVNVSRVSRNGALNISTQPTVWIYLALTAPLTIATLLAWWGWEWRSRRYREAESTESAWIA